MTITEAINAVLANWNRTPQEINAGHCVDFAIDVYELLDSHGNHDYEVWEVEGFHTYFKVGKLFFDAETPKGVKKLSDLSIFRRRDQPGRPTNLRGKRLR